MLETPELKSRFQFEETEPFILRVMVATIILYDHVHPLGAFVKGMQIFCRILSLIVVFFYCPLLNRIISLKLAKLELPPTHP